MIQITVLSDKLTKKKILNRVADVPGGVSLTISTLITGNVVQEGTPLTAPASGLRTVCKQAQILTGSTTTVFRVENGVHHFKVGDFVLRQVGGLAYAITAVDLSVDTTDNVTYDTITVGTALESATIGEFIYQAAAESTGITSALENSADVILKEAFQVPSTAQVVFGGDAFTRADVIESAIGSLYLTDLKGIIEVKY